MRTMIYNKHCVALFTEITAFKSDLFATFIVHPSNFISELDFFVQSILSIVFIYDMRPIRS